MREAAPEQRPLGAAHGEQRLCRDGPVGVRKQRECPEPPCRSDSAPRAAAALVELLRSRLATSSMMSCASSPAWHISI